MSNNQRSTNRHVIRLAGPWFIHWYSPAGEAGQSPAQRSSALRQNGAEPVQRAKVPIDLSSLVIPPNAHRLELVRKFHCPTNLAPQSKVWLDVHLIELWDVVKLNDQRIWSPPDHEAHSKATTRSAVSLDVTGRLRTHNCLVLERSMPPVDSPDSFESPNDLFDHAGTFDGARLTIVSPD